MRRVGAAPALGRPSWEVDRASIPDPLLCGDPRARGALLAERSLRAVLRRIRGRLRRSLCGRIPARRR